MAVGIVPFAAISAAQRRQAAEVLVRAFAHAPAAWHTPEEATLQVGSFFEDLERSALAAIDEDGRVLGWIGLVRGYSHAFELHPLAVDPDAQRRGVGTQLVRALEAQARDEGALSLWLGADDDFGGTTLFGADPFPDLLATLATARSLGPSHPLDFYRKMGFVLAGLLPDANGRGRHDILMAKRLA
jgi:aminoglycoside 6'-N-acetyltransferase I